MAYRIEISPTAIEEGFVYIHPVGHGSQQRLENIQYLLGDEL